MLKRYLMQAPTLVVIGVSGLTAWPSLFPERAPTRVKGEAKPQAKAKESPSIAGATDRDPFQMAGVAKPKTAPEAKSTAKAAPAKVERRVALPTVSADEDKILAGMSLGGTFIGGRDRLAIIDDKVYALGDQLRKADGSPLPYVIADVLQDRAVLRRGRRDFVLAFSNKPRAAGPKAEGPALAKSVTPTQSAPRPAPEAKPTVMARVEAGPRPKGLSPSNQPGGDAGNPASMLLQLLSGIGGPPGTGGASPASAPAGQGQAAGPSMSFGGVEINQTTLQAGLDALTGKHDNIGREGTTP